MIALITDFGLSDPYAGQMKGAILAAAPDARIVDVSHLVEPHNVVQAGFFLAASLNVFPEGTVFVAVVDPGVGGSRRIAGADIRGRLVLAPDNGLLGLALRGPGPVTAFDVTPKPGALVSATFHGRDLFAPLAARLDSGERLETLGSRIDPASLASAPWFAARIEDDGWRAAVVHIDRFGNCVLGVPDRARLGGGVRAALVSPVQAGLDIARTYEDLVPGRIGLIRGSQGFYELAANQRSAASQLGLRMGDAVAIEFTENREAS